MDIWQFGRRRFLQSASALGLGVGLGSWELLRGITPAHAADLQVGPDAVRFRPEIEPVVRWIEETPQDRALEVAIGHLKDGLSYRDLLAGLFLAGIRNVKPRPVGFKFHAVMVMNSAHLLGQTAAAPDRLLPMLWALDNFKKSQAQDIKEGDWTLNKVDEARLPRPDQAKAEFIRAMDAWDADAADVAIAALCRTRGAAEVMEPLYRFGIRDQRNIGHKPIFTMQCWRTLQAIGWQHAEPVLRSLVYGQLDLMNDSRGVSVGPYEANLENARKIRDDWQTGKPDPSATRALLETLRQASPEGASAEAVTLLNRGIAAESLWDAVILAANETLMRSPGHPRPARRDLGQRAALHLRRQRRRHHPPPGAAPGRRLAADVPRPDQARRGAGHRRPGAEGPRDPGRRGRRRDLRHHRQERREQGRRRRQGRRLPERGGLDRPALRRRPPHDLPQGARQPRLQVRRRRLGGMRARLRPQVARPPGRRHDVQPPRLEDPRQPAHESGPRGGRVRVLG